MRRVIAEKIGLGNKKATDPGAPADAEVGSKDVAEVDNANSLAAKPRKQAPKMSAAKAAKALLAQRKRPQNPPPLQRKRRRRQLKK
jgi:hypothetical protein